MRENVDARVAELLISRMCHELVGPLGAVCNGLELAGEGGEFAEEALTMSEACANQLSSRVKFFRIAYGMAGRIVTNAPELRSLAIAFLEESDAALEWPMPPVAPSLREGEGKLLLNMICIAEDCLPRGGVVKVNLEGVDITVEAHGKSASLAPEMEQILEGQAVDSSLDELSPRNVHFYWGGVVAARTGRRLRWEHLPGGVGVSFRAI